MTIWATLGIAPTTDRAAIRRAYAKALRATSPEDDAEGFKTLRAAYEIALDHADRAAALDEGDSVPVIMSEAALHDLLDTAPGPAAPAFDSAPAEAPEPPAPFTQRDAAIADLNALLGTLAQGLHGPWHSDEGGLRETLAAILAAPALDEIAVRADVEQAIAELIAATIPRSDAILLEAARALGWPDAPTGTVSHPVAVALARLDEWRLIATFDRRRHPLHAAWRSLTRPPGPYWRWRLAALRPGLGAGVETLLGLDAPIAAGLSYSFNAAAVARWRALIARPHWRSGMIAALPLVGLVLFFLADALDVRWLDSAAGGWAMVAILLLSPIAPFAAAHARARWLRRWHPQWQAHGWIGALGVVWLGAALLPASPAGLIVLGSAATFVWVWMAVAAGPAFRAERIARLRASWLPVLLCALFGMAAASTLDPVHRAALAVMLALGATLMGTPLTPIALLAMRWRRWRADLTVPLVLALGAVAYGGACLVVPGDDARRLYAATLTLIAGSLVVSIAQHAPGGARAYRALRLVRALLLGAFLFAAIAAIGDETTPMAVPPSDHTIPLV